MRYISGICLDFSLGLAWLMQTALTQSVLVEEYSGLALTFEKDVLPALAGLALEFAGLRPGDRYLAGLWEKSLLNDLAWCRDLSVTTNPRPVVYRAPSWSWASITQRVFFYSSLSEEEGARARVISANTTLAGPDARGEVEAGSIVLVAPVQLARIVWAGTSHFDVETDSRQTPPVCCTVDSISDCLDGAVSLGSSVLLLLLKANDVDSFFLVLTQAQGRPGAYRRAGINTHKQISRLEYARTGWFRNEVQVEIV